MRSVIAPSWTEPSSPASAAAGRSRAGRRHRLRAAPNLKGTFFDGALVLRCRVTEEHIEMADFAGADVRESERVGPEAVPGEAAEPETTARSPL